MRSNAKLSAGLKRSLLRGGHVPPVPGFPLALDPLVVMAVIRNNEWLFSECINECAMCIGKFFGTLRADRYKQADHLTEWPLSEVRLYARHSRIHNISRLLTLGAHAHSEGYSSCRVCMCVCMCVCMYVWPLITAASHIGITKQRYQRVHSNTAIVLNFADFPKNASFKSYGVICLPQAAPAS